MPKPRWNVTREISKVGLTQVFSGGACNIRDREGNLLRNEERDRINDWLTDQKIVLFDPQIHPDTHGEEYHYPKHHVMEVAARKAAKLTLYEVSPSTFGGVTSLELAIDSHNRQAPTIVYYSDNDAGRDTLPPYSEQGYPLFEPDGIKLSPKAMKAHYEEFRKNANHMRRYVVHFAQELKELTVHLTDNTTDGDVVIHPDRMHAADLFEAVTAAAGGKRVMINFTGGRAAQDEQGVPIFIAPDDPPPMTMKTLLDQYVDEGNELRERICKLIDVNVFTRVVYTERAAIDALDELLHVKGILV